jgi:hypothetical protein
MAMDSGGEAARAAAGQVLIRPERGSQSTRNPPPPRLPAWGRVTARAKALATAASTALPPRRSTAAPTAAARASWAATMPPLEGIG